MDISVLNVISNVLLVSIPTLTVGGACYLTMRTFVRRDQELRVLELRAASRKETLLLKLQAYERMVLFLERISPALVISRVLDNGMNNHELQMAMIQDIRSEYEHNLTQQMYMSSDAWTLVVSAKDEIIKAVGMIASHMPATTDGQQVARVILDSIAHSGQMLPNITALEFLKNEVREMM
jgi:hypothetical protein